MSDSTEHRVRRLFDRASQLHGEARQSLLRDVRATDPGLAEEVSSLLEHHERTDAILDRTPGGASAGSPTAPVTAGTEAPLDEPALPAQIGAYTLLRVIGSGGMGVVYEAEQASPRRRVAVKLIRPELVSASMLRRFEHEAEALGMLDHPGIARVYEAGRAPLRGFTRAFIAMEFIDGSPVTDHAARAGLTPAERMLLLARVCDAIDSAHQRGVIHRDLKPANILVGADGRPRVLDFGVARLGPADGAGTMMTAAGQIVGTLAYMSPEQASADAARIDGRSDVYSLGAILFELLCGRPPIDITGMSIQGALAAVQSVRPAVPRESRRSLGRDAEAILLRALEKDPARRYQHASDLGDDLRRLLRGEPVTARSPSALYQLTRFCARHRELAGAAALVLATLVIAMIAVSAALVRAERALASLEKSEQAAVKARDEAVAQADLATRNMQRYSAVSGFMRTLLGSVRPGIARGMDTSLLRAMLEQAEGDLGMLDGQPEAAADAHGLLAQVYRSLGEFSRSERHAVRSLELYRETLGEETAATATAMHNLGSLYRGSLRRFDEAEPLLRRSVELFVALEGRDSEAARSSQSALALLYMDTGRYAEAEPILRELREHAERLAGLDDPATLRAMHNHAGALSMIGRDAEAERLARRVFEGRSRLLGEDHTDTATSMLFLATCLRSLDRTSEALPLTRRSAELRRAQLGDAHHLTILARVHLAQILRDLGHLQEADAEARAAVASARESLGESHMETLQAELAALEIRVLLGRCDGAVQAAAALRDEFGSAVARSAPFWPLVADAVRGLALACAGEESAGETTLIAAYDELTTLLGPTNRITRRIAEMLAVFHRQRGRGEQAELWSARSSPAPE